MNGCNFNNISHTGYQQQLFKAVLWWTLGSLVFNLYVSLAVLPKFRTWKMASKCDGFQYHTAERWPKTNLQLFISGNCYLTSFVLLYLSQVLNVVLFSICQLLMTSSITSNQLLQQNIKVKYKNNITFTSLQMQSLFIKK